MDTDHQQHRQQHQRLRSNLFQSTIADIINSGSRMRSRHHVTLYSDASTTPYTASTSLTTPTPTPTASSIFDESARVASTVKATSVSVGQLSGAAMAVRGTSFAVMALIVVASLCAVVGAIYLLIYFKSIKPMAARSRSYKDSGGGAKGDDDGSRSKSAHPFFRHK